MSSITCSSTQAGDFSLVIDGTAYSCTSSAPPFVVVNSGGLTRSDFDALVPGLTLLLVLAFGFQMARKVMNV
jgi:hypothetical protein